MHRHRQNRYRQRLAARRKINVTDHPSQPAVQVSMLTPARDPSATEVVVLLGEIHILGRRPPMTPLVGATPSLLRAPISGGHWRAALRLAHLLLKGGGAPL